jgi:large subunit ribosomal protein L20
MRATKGAARTKAKRRIFKQAKGYFSGRRKLYRTAVETVERAGAFAYRDRRAKKREFRRLWIIRLSAACQERGLRYSQLIAGLKAANITLDRKSLSEIAIADPVGFDAVVGEVKKALQL